MSLDHRRDRVASDRLWYAIVGSPNAKSSDENSFEIHGTDENNPGSTAQRFDSDLPGTNARQPAHTSRRRPDD
ncbi:hypothetical protein [Roseiconus lacunae]|uniref:Uncharacterized protein n=1 Tax=Roseiconus lacunae TaxID=2605694 RepID=A0ABT7PD46_9BACT|nr:hypothetical protein [Roseiconus lacunae]MDM4014406.1 hypothetical protein [Roseiconus lacunae]